MNKTRTKYIQQGATNVRVERDISDCGSSTRYAMTAGIDTVNKQPAQSDTPQPARLRASPSLKTFSKDTEMYFRFGARLPCF